MTQPLCRAALPALPASIERPSYDFERLRVGMVHLGVGAFHRAHQALYTEDAIRAGGGEWGVLGVALRSAATPDALSRQECLYTVETLVEPRRYRIVAAIRKALCAPLDPSALTAALAAPDTHVVTLTVTEKGYCLAAGGALDVSHPDVVHDLSTPRAPRSAIGWLAHGLHTRHAAHGAPITVVSCDNLKDNGTRLKAALETFLERTHPSTLAWLRREAAFPRTVVDCIVPASSEASRARVAAALGVEDLASVQREPYSQWVIEDRFAGPRPAWQRAGALLVSDPAHHGRLKLHVLNTCHSALAYLGLPHGHQFVREAILDDELAQFLEELVAREIAPALPALPVAEYWQGIRKRFANPHIDHRLAQIAEDGAQKLAERAFPLMIANLATGAPVHRLARIVRGWLKHAHITLQQAFESPTLLPAAIRSNPAMRAAIQTASS